MEQFAASSFIKAEHIEGVASRSEPLQTINDKETSDSDEVSPSATDDSSVNPWSALKCIFCDKSALRFDEVKLLECLHTACIDCINTRLNTTGEDKKCKFHFWSVLFGTVTLQANYYTLFAVL